MMNMNNNKFRKIVSTIIVVILVVAMIVPVVLSAIMV